MYTLSALNCPHNEIKPKQNCFKQFQNNCSETVFKLFFSVFFSFISLCGQIQRYYDYVLYKVTIYLPTYLLTDVTQR